MTLPPSSATPDWPKDPAPPVPPAGPQIRAVDGNRAALMLLVVQNVVAALLIGQLKLGLGAALLITFLATALVGWLLFRPALTALFADTRWRTPPSWGLALGAFALAFLASRAFAFAYVTLFPSAAATIPQFLSHGPDLIFLILAAGILVPLAEEIAFRGLMMRGQERAAGFTVAALATTLAFSVAHGVPASIVGILPLAYVLARVVQHSGSLWNSVIIHALNNTLSVVLGAVVAGKTLTQPNEAAQLLSNPSLRLPLLAGSLLFGAAVMLVVQLWLTPRPDPQVGRARGPWLSAAYVVIVLFGIAAVVIGLPTVQESLTHLRDALR